MVLLPERCALERDRKECGDGGIGIPNPSTDAVASVRESVSGFGRIHATSGGAPYSNRPHHTYVFCDTNRDCAEP
jgi:hypothetical protein